MTSDTISESAEKWSKLANPRQKKAGIIDGLRKASSGQQQRICAANELLDGIFKKLYDELIKTVVFGRPMDL
jgi:hypothetical protein